MFAVNMHTHHLGYLQLHPILQHLLEAFRFFHKFHGNDARCTYTQRHRPITGSSSNLAQMQADATKSVPSSSPLRAPSATPTAISPGIRPRSPLIHHSTSCVADDRKPPQMEASLHAAMHETTCAQGHPTLARADRFLIVRLRRLGSRGIWGSIRTDLRVLIGLDGGKSASLFGRWTGS